jgi:hypothetical protein
VKKRQVLDGKCDYKSCQGIENYKSALGFPALPESFFVTVKEEMNCFKRRMLRSEVGRCSK